MDIYVMSLTTGLLAAAIVVLTIQIIVALHNKHSNKINSLFDKLSKSIF